MMPNMNTVPADLMPWLILVGIAVWLTGPVLALIAIKTVLQDVD